MNLQGLRDAVRSQLDLPDEADLSTSLLDLYLREAFQQVTNLESQWPFYETTWTVSATDDGLPIAMPSDLATVASVVDADFALSDVAHADAEEQFGTASLGRPEMFSTWGSSLYLWPRSDAVRAYTIRGWRKPDETWLDSASGEPDTGADRRIDLCLVHYACYRVFAQQEDDVLASFYYQTFERTAFSARQAIMRSEYQGSVQMGSGIGRRRFGNLFRLST